MSANSELRKGWGGGPNLANFSFPNGFKACGERERSWSGKAGKITQEGKRIFEDPTLRVIFLLVGTPLPMDCVLRPSFNQASQEGPLKLFPQRELTGL